MSNAVTVAKDNPVYAGMPARYHVPWKQPFDQKIESELRPGMRILDVGPGRAPAVVRERLPPGCIYAGLDLSYSELRKAPDGSYDEIHVADICTQLPDLNQQFDLAVSWQVLEHVKSLDEALANIRSYLKPGGRFIAQFSGTFSIFGLINKAIPQGAGLWLLRTLLKRNPETVFPAYYHHCWYGAIAKAMADWSEVEIIDRHQSGAYFNFAPPIRRLYAKVEDWAMNGHHRNFASHYLVDARR